MDPGTFQSFKTQLSKEHFSDGKLGVVRSFAQNHWFSGHQVAAALETMKFPSDQLQGLDIMAPRMMPISGQEGKLIVDKFAHSNDKLKAVEVIANHINDPVNKYVVLDAVTFHFDKEEARKILDRAVFTPNPGCHPHHHHHHHHHPPACPPQSYQDPIPQGGFNISFNPGMGIPGFSASFAGGPPPQQYQQQQQPSYPGYPPPQQPRYPPPQQPGYPPPQQPGYPPPQQPGYPPPQQPGYPPSQQPGYPPSGYPPPQGYPYPSYP